MKKSIMKGLCLAICLVLIAATFSACGGQTANTEKASEKATTVETSNSATDVAANKDTLEYSIYFGLASPEKYAKDNSSDVVSPYVEKKFNIKVKEMIQPSESIQPKERLNMFIAANNIPDVMEAGQDMCDYAVSTGKFADLTSYIADMKNLNKYFPQDQWYKYLNGDKKFQIPQLTPMETDPKYGSDPFMVPYKHAMWVREDILAKLGYKFTPLDDIAKQYMDQGQKAPLDAYKIEPAIDTPDKYLDLLRKIKALNIKVGDKALIPLSTTWWSTFHIGTMFDTGHWRVDDSGNVAGFLGSAEEKDWMKMLNTMYKEGLIDPAYVLQKDDQLQSKIASGQVAAGMQIPDMAGAVNSLAKIDPSYKIRFIPIPKKNPDRGFYDILQPSFNRIVISKDFKDIKRLTQYFDWFYSDEGLDTLTWGPESAGLYEVKDGKKVFKDAEIEDSLVNGTKDGKKGPENYGLWAPSGNSSQTTFFTSKVALCAPVMGTFNPFDSRKSYPIKIDKYMANRQVAIGGYDQKGIASYGDGGANTSATASYFWGKFQNDRIGKILSAKTDADFESAWKEQYELFVKEGKYNEAKADMEKWFKEHKK